MTTKLFTYLMTVIAGMILALSLPFVVSAQTPSNIVVQFQNTPLFSEANFLPGDSVIRFVKVTNNTSSTKDIKVKAISVFDPDNFGSAFTIQIKQGAIILYSNTLQSFFNASDAIFLSNLAGNGTLTQYDFIVQLVNPTGNEYQEKNLSFDIQIGFSSGEAIVLGSVTSSGRGGGGGGGHLPLQTLSNGQVSLNSPNGLGLSDDLGGGDEGVTIDGSSDETPFDQGQGDRGGVGTALAQTVESENVGGDTTSNGIATVLPNNSQFANILGIFPENISELLQCGLYALLILLIMYTAWVAINHKNKNEIWQKQQLTKKDYIFFFGTGALVVTALYFRPLLCVIIPFIIFLIILVAVLYFIRKN